MMRYSLPTTNINKIGLCIIGLVVFYHYLVPHISLEHFNKEKNVLYMQKLVVSQVIMLNKSKTTQKTSLVITTLNIRYNQAIKKSSNARLQNIKVLMVMKI